MDKRAYWLLVLSASAILMITMGVRQSLGLFVSPLNTATGLGIVTVSFALAVGQFVWGAAQPLFGARYLATLFGLTLLSHQIGGFFGAWLGGIAIDSTGSYQWMWYADIGLASMARRW